MENMMLGVELLIIGMGTVILSLYLLSVFLFFSGKLFGPEAGKKKKKEEIENKTAEKKESVSSKKAEVKGLDKKKIAAISAALYEMMGSKKNLRIISIRKNNNNWTR
jgi:sodium pump decarboxylase gamma subunit